MRAEVKTVRRPYHEVEKLFSVEDVSNTFRPSGQSEMCLSVGVAFETVCDSIISRKKISGGHLGDDHHEWYVEERGISLYAFCESRGEGVAGVGLHRWSVTGRDVQNVHRARV